MQPSNTTTERRLAYVGFVHQRRAVYTLRKDIDGWEVYRDGVLIKSGIMSLSAALDCAHADERRRN